MRELTEIAHDNGVATDYHINEYPMTEQEHFKHLEENSTYLTPEDWPKVDELLDWLDAKRHNEGYKMVNQSKHMQDMKLLMRGEVPTVEVPGRADSLIIRTDGTLAPCFPMYSATHDWGTVGDHKFDVRQLDKMKQESSKQCLLRATTSSPKVTTSAVSLSGRSGRPCTAFREQPTLSSKHRFVKTGQ